jgi:hypothetical protein
MERNQGPETGTTRGSHYLTEAKESEKRMNLTPIIRQLSEADYQKLLATCEARDRMLYGIARLDSAFEFHVDLPGPDGQPPANMGPWLADETRFP